MWVAVYFWLESPAGKHSAEFADVCVRTVLRQTIKDLCVKLGTEFNLFALVNMMINAWQILVSHGGNYEDYYVLGRDAV